MDETLRAELQDSIERHERDAVFVPPNTISIKGYVLSDREKTVPSEIARLQPGKYNVAIQDIDYRALVADKNGVRYFMLFDSESQHQRERQFLFWMAVFGILLTAGSAAGGHWLAGHVIAPVSRLAQQVSEAEAQEVDLSLAKLARDDELGDLARAFDRYIHRMREFTQRESYFTADVSHELRTPLAVILGTVEVLEQDAGLTVKQKDRIDRIARAVHDMIGLTNALLLLAREHRLDNDEPLCPAREVLNSCVERHRHLIIGHPILLEIEASIEFDLPVERPLLEILIGNLLRNSMFYTEAGMVSLHLDPSRLVVQDTGRGMDAEQVHRAFERHYKGPTSSGAGIGLSLVKRICDRYGWVLTMSSDIGRGTKVEVAFQSVAKTPN
jgi:signal transduction histidine kinase